MNERFFNGYGNAMDKINTYTNGLDYCRAIVEGKGIDADWNAGFKTAYQEMTNTDVLHFVTDAQLHISKGNGKTGDIRSFNKIPGNGYQCKKSGEQLCNVSGTCPISCPGCYAMRDYGLNRKYVIRNWAENTLLARECMNNGITGARSKFENSLLYYFTEHPAKYLGEPFRIHSAGEFERVEEIKVWIKVARQCPEFRFYTYTKRFDLLEQLDIKIPDNFNINLSTIDSLECPIPGFNCFVWDTEGTLQTVHCPAVLKGGRRNKKITCLQCQKCIIKTGNITAVYEH